MSARVPGVFLALCAALLMPWQPFAHESPVDHVDRAIRIWIDGNRLFVRYQIQLSERAATLQVGRMDANTDGAVSSAERDAFFRAAQLAIARELKIKLDGTVLELKPDGAVELLPQFRQSYRFSAPLDALANGEALAKGRFAGELLDHYSRNYPGAYRWDEPKGAPVGNARVVVSEAPRTHAIDGHPSVLLIRFDVQLGPREQR